MTASDLKSDSTVQPAKPRRRWYQFTLRTAGVWIALLCLLLGSFAWWRDRAERQRKVVEELRGLGARVEYSYFSLTKERPIYTSFNPRDEFFLCSWLRQKLGDDFVSEVDSVHLANGHFSPSLPRKSTRAAWSLLQKCRHVKYLGVEGNTVSGDDLEKLPFLESLISLHFVTHENGSRGGLSDEDLIVLRKARSLRDVHLSNQPIGDTGIKNLCDCRYLRVVTLSDTDVSDTTLEFLSGFEELEVIGLARTKATAEGIKQFRIRNPNCEVDESCSN
ncbi:MAG: hypothetical protein ACKVP0_18630 [Pirellulaceae bacterium]